MSNKTSSKFCTLKLLLKYPLPLLALLCVTLFIAGWHLWGDFPSDLGFNVYTFWQLAKGKKLYTELAYYHGPIAPLLDASIFKIFGISIEKLAAVHAAIVFLIVSQIHLLFKKIFDSTTAWLVSLFFLLAFAFVQNDMVNSYNYILPYKSEALYGVFFFLTGFSCLWHWRESGGSKSLFAYGFCIGLSLLTSIEFSYANLFSLAFVLLASRHEIEKTKKILILGAGLFLPLCFSTLYFATYNSLGAAIHFSLRALIPAFDPATTAKLPFYQNLSGLDAVTQNAAQIATTTIVFLGIQSVFLLLSQHAKQYPTKILSVLVTSLAVFYFFLQSKFSFLSYWKFYPHIFPFFILFFFGQKIFQVFTLKKLSPRNFLLGAWVSLSFTLLLKNSLRPQVNYYGFLLAMPSALLLAAFLCSELPLWLATKNLNIKFFRLINYSLLLLISLLHFEITLRNYEFRSIFLGTGGDGIGIYDKRTDDQAELYSAALQWISENIVPSATLQIFPEGDIFNYMTRHERTLPFTLHPMEFRHHGEEKILQNLEKKPPDFIGVQGRNARGFGYGPFGTDPKYGKKIKEWILLHYQEKIHLGFDPYAEGQMGIIFYEHKVK